MRLTSSARFGPERIKWRRLALALKDSRPWRGGAGRQRSEDCEARGMTADRLGAGCSRPRSGRDGIQNGARRRRSGRSRAQSHVTCKLSSHVLLIGVGVPVLALLWQHKAPLAEHQNRVHRAIAVHRLCLNNRGLTYKTVLTLPAAVVGQRESLNGVCALM